MISEDTTDARSGSTQVPGDAAVDTHVIAALLSDPEMIQGVFESLNDKERKPDINQMLGIIRLLIILRQSASRVAAHAGLGAAAGTLRHEIVALESIEHELTALWAEVIEADAKLLDTTVDDSHAVIHAADEWATIVFLLLRSETALLRVLYEEVRVVMALMTGARQSEFSGRFLDVSLHVVQLEPRTPTVIASSERAVHFLA